MAPTDEMIKLPWWAWLDLDTEYGGDGSARVALSRPKPEHLNHHQHVNAPVIYGVAEAAGVGAVVFGAGSAGTGAYTVVRSATINYQRPAHGGVTAICNLAPELTERMRLELEKGRGCDVDVDVSVIDADNTPTGTCRLIVSLRPRR
jgi:acyl-coenzyme A thioesterase PaaI-like protein